MVLPIDDLGRPKMTDKWRFGVGQVVLGFKIEMSTRKELDILWIEQCTRLVFPRGDSTN